MERPLPSCAGSEKRGGEGIRKEEGDTGQGTDRRHRNRFPGGIAESSSSSSPHKNIHNSKSAWSYDNCPLPPPPPSDPLNNRRPTQLLPLLPQNFTMPLSQRMAQMGIRPISMNGSPAANLRIQHAVLFHLLFISKEFSLDVLSIFASTCFLSHRNSFFFFFVPRVRPGIFSTSALTMLFF